MPRPLAESGYTRQTDRAGEHLRPRSATLSRTIRPPDRPSAAL